MIGTGRTGVVLGLWLALVAPACGPPPPAVDAPPPAAPVPTSVTPTDTNPAAPGFDMAGSDRRAIEIADRVMARLGGHQAWDETRYLSWRFFGGRRHVWDKWTGNLRFEDDELTVLTNIHSRHGGAWRDGERVADPDSAAAAIDKAYRAWINDSYWLVMPYKLKDTGVTLTHVGADMTEEGLPAELLELRFRDVGVTPQNRYQVWVDVHTSLVRQWAFYRNAEEDETGFVLPWSNWQPYGRIWLADDFGRRRHTEVAVFDELPESVFTHPGPIQLPKKSAPPAPAE